ncbi:ATP-binding protein [Streptomyces sp. NPDC057689]|uniref:ATP-binding protein n=1 Tax=Streptomyces sp. NPDC057689 TaxID=3346213 RepID=UPI0036CDF1D6
MIKNRTDKPPCCVPPTGPPAQALFVSDEEAAGHARRHVRAVLTHDDPPVADEPLDDVLVVVSELVTNAYRYGTKPGDSMTVVVLTTPERVRIEVHDTIRRRPTFRKGGNTRGGDRGRGLHIVDALSVRWDVDDRPNGKAVWAEVAR